jgi:hypothetical protein
MSLMSWRALSIRPYPVARAPPPLTAAARTADSALVVSDSIASLTSLANRSWTSTGCQGLT